MNKRLQPLFQKILKDQVETKEGERSEFIIQLPKNQRQ